MADYTLLKAELDGQEYDGMSDADAATHYNAKTYTVRNRYLPIPRVLQWAGAGPIDSIDAAQSFTHSDAATQKAVRASCKAAMRLFNGSTETFDLDSAINRQLLGLFLAVGLISQEEHDGLIALGDSPSPYYQQAGQFGHPVSADDVNYARSLG